MGAARGPFSYPGAAPEREDLAIVRPLILNIFPTQSEDFFIAPIGAVLVGIFEKKSNRKVAVYITTHLTPVVSSSLSVFARYATLRSTR
jgi:hypothetical protein